MHSFITIHEASPGQALAQGTALVLPLPGPSHISNFVFPCIFHIYKLNGTFVPHMMLKGSGSLCALPTLAQVWSMEYAPKLAIKTGLTTVRAHTHAHTHPSRYTPETCQQVIIFHVDGSELLGAFQLCSLFRLHFPPSLQLFLNPGALGQGTCSALSVLPLLVPVKNDCPELYNFQSKHVRSFTTQPSPGAESYVSIKSVPY